MEERFKNLALVFNMFTEQYDLDREQNIGSLDLSIKHGSIDKAKLKEEFTQGISDLKFDWIKFAKDHQLMIDPSPYTNAEILNYSKYLVWEYLFPEKTWSKDKIQEFVNDAIKILKEETKNDGWLFSDNLYEALKRKHEDLEYFYLYYIMPLAGYQLEKRFVKGKDIEVGYLKYKGN